ncbi:MAG: FG-GAP-like repeat-containing protein [Longimicrobiaceae bacterium]
MGARVIVKRGGRMQMLEQMPTRGFQSSVDPRLHFGLGTDAVVDTLLVVWPDRRYQLLTQVAADRLLTLRQADASGVYQPEAAPEPLFEPVPLVLNEQFRHRENSFIDFNREPFMPHMLSTEGPALAVGDVNGDGLDDFYIGGAKWQSGALYMQRPDGSFGATSQPVFQADSLYEDVTAVFFDANGNGHLDLYVGSGGNEFWGEQEPLRDRLYLNDGAGNLRRATGALPDLFANTSTVAPADFDGDGHIDLFVGSRVVTSAYGVTPRSYLLRNDGTGHFTDVTDALAPGLAEAGMVTDAVWIDYDGNGALDLVVVGEWMPVRLFQLERGRFIERTEQSGLDGTSGWWSSVAAADVDGDGHVDLVLGNLGRNSYIRAVPDQPVRLHVADFAGNGKQDQMLTFYKHGVSYPIAMRDDLVKRSPPLRKRYASYAAFGASRLDDIFPGNVLKNALVREARTLSSAVARNNGDGTFRIENLPSEAQFGPVYSILVDDFSGDGATDLLLAGNFYGVTPVRGRYDANPGTLLRGDGRGGFTALDWTELGVTLDGQVRALRPLRTARGVAILVARNDDTPLLIRPRRQTRHSGERRNP